MREQLHTVYSPLALRVFFELIASPSASTANKTGTDKHMGIKRNLPIFFFFGFFFLKLGKNLSQFTSFKVSSAANSLQNFLIKNKKG